MHRIGDGCARNSVHLFRFTGFDASDDEQFMELCLDHLLGRAFRGRGALGKLGLQRGKVGVE